MQFGRLGFWHRLVVSVSSPFLRIATTRDWRSQERNSSTGGVILAANHISKVDPMTPGRYVRCADRVPRYPVKSSLFASPLTRRTFIGSHQIPVDRDPADALAALVAAVKAIDDGECLLIYPEGTVTRDSDRWPTRTKSGVARLALITGAPVVPVAQWGPQRLWPYKSKLPRVVPRKQILIVTGAPVDLSAYTDQPWSHDVLHQVTELIMAGITDLLVEIRGGQPPAVTHDPSVAA